jgi:hypothetical protein
MVLAEGDNVRFGLPGLPGTIYSFARQNDAVTVEATPTWINLAQN